MLLKLEKAVDDAIARAAPRSAGIGGADNEDFGGGDLYPRCAGLCLDGCAKQVIQFLDLVFLLRRQVCRLDALKSLRRDGASQGYGG